MTPSPSNLGELIAEANDLGFRINFFQDQDSPKWHCTVYCPSKKGMQGRYFASGDGATLEAALTEAIIDIKKPPREISAPYPRITFRPLRKPRPTLADL